MSLAMVIMEEKIKDLKHKNNQDKLLNLRLSYHRKLKNKNSQFHKYNAKIDFKMVRFNSILWSNQLKRQMMMVKLQSNLNARLVVVKNVKSYFKLQKDGNNLKRID